MEVLVLIVPDKNSVSRKGLLERKFSDDLFNVVDLTDEAFPNPVSDIDNMSQDEIHEANVWTFALKFSHDNYKDSPVVVVKDTTISDSSPGHISRVTQKILSFDQESFDMCYYADWMDQCQLFSVLGSQSEKVLKKEQTTIVRTHSPNGVQCIYFTTKGRDTILEKRCMRNGNYFSILKDLGAQFNDEVFHRNLVAALTVPTLFDYDIILNAMDNDDYLKMNLCLPVESRDNGSNGGNGLVLFVFIVVILILIAYPMIKLGPRK